MVGIRVRDLFGWYAAGGFRSYAEYGSRQDVSGCIQTDPRIQLLQF